MPATRLYLDACKEFLLLLSHEPSLAKLKDVPESVERLSEQIRRRCTESGRASD